MALSRVRGRMLCASGEVSRMRKRSEIQVSAIHFRIYRASKEREYDGISSSSLTKNKRAALSMVMRKTEWKFVDWTYEPYYQPLKFQANCDLATIMDIIRTVRMDKTDLRYIADHPLDEVEKWLYAKKVVE